MAIAATITSKISVVETTSTSAPAINATAQNINYLDDTTLSLAAGTSVPATKVVKFRQAMTDGSATIDLTAITDLLKNAVSLSGLKVQAIKITSLAANANAITITEGASNGYELGGNGFTWILQPGQSLLATGNDATPDVGSGAKTIDISGTGTQALDITIVAG